MPSSASVGFPTIQFLLPEAVHPVSPEADTVKTLNHLHCNPDAGQFLKHPLPFYRHRMPPVPDSAAPPDYTSDPIKSRDSGYSASTVYHAVNECPTKAALAPLSKKR